MTTRVSGLCVQQSPLTLLQDFLRTQDDGETLTCSMAAFVAENK